jgi:hypothetical protein
LLAGNRFRGGMAISFFREKLWPEPDACYARSHAFRQHVEVLPCNVGVKFLHFVGKPKARHDFPILTLMNELEANRVGSS